MHESDKFLLKIISIIVAIIVIPLLIFALIKGGISMMLMLGAWCIGGIVVIFIAALTSMDAEINSPTFVGSFFEIWSKIHGISLLVFSGIALCLLTAIVYAGAIVLLRFF
jgi:hypothetical protein